MLEDHYDTLVRETRELLARAAQAIADGKEQNQRGHALLTSSIEHLAWSDHLKQDTRYLVDQLRHTVSRIATVERQSGTAPEQVVRLLKSLVIEAHDDMKLEAIDARSLMDDIVRWGIESYYAA